MHFIVQTGIEMSDMQESDFKSHGVKTMCCTMIVFLTFNIFILGHILNLLLQSADY